MSTTTGSASDAETTRLSCASDARDAGRVGARLESVAEYLARGGVITKVPIGVMSDSYFRQFVVSPWIAKAAKQKGEWREHTTRYNKPCRVCHKKIPQSKRQNKVWGKFWPNRNGEPRCVAIVCSKECCEVWEIMREEGTLL